MSTEPPNHDAAIGDTRIARVPLREMGHSGPLTDSPHPQHVNGEAHDDSSLPRRPHVEVLSSDVYRDPDVINSRQPLREISSAASPRPQQVAADDDEPRGNQWPLDPVTGRPPVEFEVCMDAAARNTRVPLGQISYTASSRTQRVSVEDSEQWPLDPVTGRPPVEFEVRMDAAARNTRVPLGQISYTAPATSPCHEQDYADDEETHDDDPPQNEPVLDRPRVRDVVGTRCASPSEYTISYRGDSDKENEDPLFLEKGSICGSSDKENERPSRQNDDGSSDKENDAPPRRGDGADSDKENEDPSDLKKRENGGRLDKKDKETEKPHLDEHATPVNVFGDHHVDLEEGSTYSEFDIDDHIDRSFGVGPGYIRCQRWLRDIAAAGAPGVPQIKNEKLGTATRISPLPASGSNTERDNTKVTAPTSSDDDARSPSSTSVTAARVLDFPKPVNLGPLAAVLTDLGQQIHDVLDEARLARCLTTDESEDTQAKDERPTEDTAEVNIMREEGDGAHGLKKSLRRSSRIATKGVDAVAAPVVADAPPAKRGKQAGKTGRKAKATGDVRKRLVAGLSKDSSNLVGRKRKRGEDANEGNVKRPRTTGSRR